MKITEITCEAYQMPMKRQYASGRGKLTVRHVFVHVHTDEGITGIGVGRSAQNLELFRQALIGQDPLCHERLAYTMYHKVSRGYQHVEAISAVDIALWDLKAKAAGLPLYRLLGGMRPSVACYMAGGYYAEGKTIADLQKEMERYQSWGVNAVKMKVGGLSPREDAQRVRAVREVLGDSAKLMMDAGGAWKYNEALEFARRVEEYFPYFLEEPCANTDIEGFKRLYAHTTVPLAAGESAVWKYGERDLIDSGALSFVQPDATLSGGVTEFLKISAYADARHIYISPHGIQQLHGQLGCAVPNIPIIEFYSTQYDENGKYQGYYRNPVQLNADGTVSPPEIPGAALETIPEMMEPYRVG